MTKTTMCVMAVLCASQIGPRPGLAEARSQQAAAPAAPSLPRPAFPVGPSQEREVIVENVYRFSQMKYVPPVEVTVTGTGTRFTTPEAAVSAHLAAMAAGDYARFLATWSKADRERLSSDDRARNRGPEYWAGVWKRVLAGRKIQLTQRLDSSPYVLIEYRLYNDKNDGSDFKDTVGLKQFGDEGWLLTQELADDPVMAQWSGPDRTRRVVR